MKNYKRAMINHRSFFVPKKLKINFNVYVEISNSLLSKNELGLFHG